MNEQRFWFVIDKGKLEYVQDNVTGKKITVSELEDLVNEQQGTITSLKEECDVLQKKIEIDKNDFFISEAKRMTLLAFIEDNGLQKEYSEWERRIYNE